MVDDRKYDEANSEESGFRWVMLYMSVLGDAAAKSLQSCLTQCDPIDGSPPGSPVPGILQARTLEWFAISFFNAWKWKVKMKSLSRVWPSAAPWTAAYQASPSMGFSRQDYWSGVPLPSPVLGDSGMDILFITSLLNPSFKLSVFFFWLYFISHNWRI